MNSVQYTDGFKKDSIPASYFKRWRMKYEAYEILNVSVV